MPDTKRTVEERLAELEHFRALVMGSRLGGEIRGLALREKQQAVEAGFEAEKTAKHAAAAPARAAGFKKFTKQCLCLEPGAECAGWAVAWSYQRFAEAEGLTADEVLTEREVLAAVRALPDVLDEIVRAGPMNNKMPGMIGVKVVGEFRHEFDAVSAEQKPSTSTFSGTSAPGTLVAGAAR